MTSRVPLGGRQLSWVLVVATVVATGLGQLLPWGVLHRGEGVPGPLRLLLIGTGVFVVGWAVLRPVLASQGVSRRTLAVYAAIVLATALGAGTYAVLFLLGSLTSAPGSWLAVCGPVLAVLTVVVLELPPVDAPRAVTVLAATAAVLTLVGTLWWPDRMVDASTTSALSSAAPALGTDVAWSRSLDHRDGFTVLGGRPVASRFEGCRATVEGLDPREGTTAWSYSRAGCAVPVVSGTDALLRVDFDVREDAHTVVYLDPGTGKLLHPDPALDAVTDWVGDYGVVSLDPDVAYRARRPEVTVLEARTGRELASFDADGCTADQSLVRNTLPQGVQTGSLRQFVTVGDGLAGGYVCAADQPGADGAVQVQRHVVFVDPGRGTVRDVPLPVTTEGVGTAGTASPEGPALAAGGDTVVVGYRALPRDASPQLLVFGVTPTGVAWRHQDTATSSFGDVRDMFAVGDDLVGTFGVLDAPTGAFRPGGEDFAAPSSATWAAAVDGSLVSLVSSGRDGGAATLQVTDPTKAVTRTTDLDVPAGRYIDHETDTSVWPIAGGVLVRQSGGVAAVLG